MENKTPQEYIEAFQTWAALEDQLHKLRDAIDGLEYWKRNADILTDVTEEGVSFRDSDWDEYLFTWEVLLADAETRLRLKAEREEAARVKRLEQLARDKEVRERQERAQYERLKAIYGRDDA